MGAPLDRFGNWLQKGIDSTGINDADYAKNKRTPEQKAADLKKAQQDQAKDPFYQATKPGGLFGPVKDASAEDLVTGPDGLKYKKSEYERMQLAKAPDLTDAAVRQARTTELARLMSGRGRKSTFLTGPMGEVGGPLPALGKTKLGGY